MDALLGKLDNLAYEFFGVFAPGVVFSFLSLLLWFALGDLVPRWTWSRIPAFSIDYVNRGAAALPGGRSAFLAGCALVATYLVGHALNWASKAHPREKGGWRRRASRLGKFLTFRTSTPGRNFDERLDPLFAAISGRLSHDGTALEWRMFYPLAKSFIANSGRQSLVGTYQNKYTLHRSIASAAAVLFWLVVFSSVGAVVAILRGAEERPEWLVLGGLAVLALVLITGFSATFAYSWRLWGDSIVTETYAALFGPGREVKNANG